MRNNKPNILISQTDLHSFSSFWLLEVMVDFFNILWHEAEPTFDPSRTLVIKNGLNNTNLWYKKYIDQGCKLVEDDLWDQPVSTGSSLKEDRLIVRNKNWFWFNESLRWQYNRYNEYVSQKNNNKHFLLLMAKEKPHRNFLYENLKEYIPNSIFSYVGKGISLDKDIDPTTGTWHTDISKSWFDDTVFSVVAETWTHGHTFVSEKTFKPIAFKHPFIIAGTLGTLDYLRKENFETFGHLIDESYDSESDETKRLLQVITEIKRLIADEIMFDDPTSIEKIKHNFDLFYNKKYVIEQLQNTLIKELLEYVEST